jgi:hypothetical protein
MPGEVATGATHFSPTLHAVRRDVRRGSKHGGVPLCCQQVMRLGNVVVFYVCQIGAVGRRENRLHRLCLRKRGCSG